MPLDLALVLGLSAAVVGFAVRYGSTPERLGALLIILNLSVDLLVKALVGEWDFARFSNVRFAVDIGEFCLIFALAFRANRVWTIFSAASQLVAVGGSIAVMKSSGGNQIAYWAITQLPLFGQLAALTLGTAAHRRRKAAIGPYRDWRPPKRVRNS